MSQVSQADRSSKDEAYWKVLSAAIELDIKKGHLRWTISDLSRKSRVTRSLIYYYFGRSKADLIKEAIKLIGEDLCGLSPERRQLWQEGHFVESMMTARRLLERMPYLGSFILEHRHQGTEIGSQLREIESGFIEKIKNTFHASAEDEIKTIYTIYWGLNFAPLVDVPVMEKLISIMKENFLPKKTDKVN